MGLIASLLLASALSLSPAQGEPDGVEGKIQQLIGRLGDKSLDVRERAERELVEIGEAALPHLREATKSADPEVQARSAKAIAAIEWVVAERVFDQALKERSEARSNWERIEHPVLAKQLPEWRIFRRKWKQSGADGPSGAVLALSRQGKLFDFKSYQGSGSRERQDALDLLPGFLGTMKAIDAPQRIAIAQTCVLIVRGFLDDDAARGDPPDRQTLSWKEDDAVCLKLHSNLHLEVRFASEGSVKRVRVIRIEK